MSLKTQNTPLLVIFVIVLGGVLWWVVKGLPATPDILGLDKYHSSAVFVGVATIVTLLITELLSRETKAILVHWRLTNVMPGCRAFSETVHKDHRIDPARLLEKLGSFPEAPEEQDRLFYRIYKQHQEDVGVIDAHKSYLLFRELATISIISMVLGSGLAFVFSQSFAAAGTYFAICGVAYVLTALAARRASVRLVANTLAVACL